MIAIKIAFKQEREKSYLTNNYLLFTDADCQPVSNQWITEITSHFNSKKTIILGYGAYSKIKNSFLNKLIRFETPVVF